LGFAAQSAVWVAPVARSLRTLSRRRAIFDFIFLDPPYDRGLAGRSLDLIAACDLVRDTGTVVVEHSARESLKPRYGSLQLHDQRRYGDTRLSFYRRVAET
jgi:16S rRNA (guanine966-N2)-methyltransferase